MPTAHNIQLAGYSTPTNTAITAAQAKAAQHKAAAAKAAAQTLHPMLQRKPRSPQTRKLLKPSPQPKRPARQSLR